MNTKNLIFAAVSAMLFYIAINIVKVADTQQSLVLAISYATMLYFLFTGVFYFLSKAYPIHTMVTDSFYTVKYKGLITTLYYVLLVDFFRYFTTLPIWNKKNDTDALFQNTASEAENAKKSEFYHILAFIAITLFCLKFRKHNEGQLALVGMILNIIGHLLPIIYYRFNRFQVRSFR